MIKIHFQKLFENVKDPGYFTNAIIAYRKVPELFDTKCDKSGCTVVPVKWWYGLRIDLWIMKLNFEWEKDISKKDDSTLPTPTKNS